MVHCVGRSVHAFLGKALLMLFGRRKAEPWVVRVRMLLWPRRSWSRSLRYAQLRLGRLPASPHAIALGIAIGVFAAFQPILGFQMLFAGVVAWLLRASVGAALLGTFIGSPLTWPFMWLASYHLGALIVGAGHQATLDELCSALIGLSALASPQGSGPAGAASETLVRQVLYPLAVGAVPAGLLAAGAFYAMVSRAVKLGRR
jgi:uncharacterized protein (DUF2062 family)